MEFLLTVALITCSGTLVYSKSNKTSCDAAVSNNVTCTQYPCSPQPCSTLCGETAPYDRCEQYCTGGGCDTLACTSSVMNCMQSCTGSGCNELKCDAKRCIQSCSGGECNMTCSSSTDECRQSCTGGLCRMICSLNVKECNQICIGGGCVAQCDAHKCSLSCPGGGCTEIKSTTPSIIATTMGTGADLKASVVSCLMFALFVFVKSHQFH